jgi:two-component system cell cycle sensor histidine kinase/response regulator CckA
VNDDELHTTRAELASWPVAAFALDLHGRIVAFNAEAELLAPGVKLGARAWHLAPGLEGRWGDIVVTGRYRGELLMTGGEARGPVERVIEAVMHMRELDGESLVIWLAVDVTRYRHAQEQADATLENERRLATSQRLESLGLVAGGIAHEFNNLLVGVVAETSVLRDDEGIPETTRDALARIEAAAKRMTHLTRQLLAYAGRGRFVTSLLDPDELIEETAPQLARRLAPGGHFEAMLGAGPIAIEGDRSLLRQVVGDLVDNAADALPGGVGKVRVVTRTSIDRAPTGGGDTRQWWHLEVHDDGVGISAAALPRIFDPFFTTKQDRRGLGLSAVLGIVRRLGGDITASSPPGGGAIVRVRLPIVPGVAAPRRQKSSSVPPVQVLTGLQILVADDEPTVRSSVRRVLERRGAIPIFASDGAEAEHLLRTQRFDLCLFDVLMPKRTGYELVPIARELQPHAPIVLMSGYSDQARGVVAPDGFLEKPFSAATLETMLRRVLGGEREPSSLSSDVEGKG